MKTLVRQTATVNRKKKIKLLYLKKENTLWQKLVNLILKVLVS